MSDEDELRQRIHKAQDDSWEAGYTSGQFSITDTPPPEISWPSHWRIGHAAALEDLAKKDATK